jgi:hypothetical protein
MGKKILILRILFGDGGMAKKNVVMLPYLGMPKDILNADRANL